MSLSKLLTYDCLLGGNGWNIKPEPFVEQHFAQRFEVAISFLGHELFRGPVLSTHRHCRVNAFACDLVSDESAVALRLFDCEIFEFRIDLDGT